MASVVTNLLSGGFMDGVSKVINSIRGKNPEDAAKLEQLQQQYKSEFLQTELELVKTGVAENIELTKSAGDIYRSDAASGKPFQAYARPAIIWVGLGMFVWNYCLVPTILFKYGFSPVPLPTDFTQAWKAVALGVVIGRSFDKMMGNTLSGQGGSVNLPFGFKIDSKGDK